jgi:hypothetical protein
MPAVPSASGSFPVANRDILSAANRTPSRWNVNSRSAANVYRFPSVTSIVSAVFTGLYFPKDKNRARAQRLV